MFSNQRYMTKRISEELSLELQMLLWSMIDDIKSTTKLDYLQVFKLEKIHRDKVYLQKITHTQEAPPSNNTVTIKVDNPIDNKIFCIDDITHSTLLFAEEY